MSAVGNTKEILFKNLKNKQRIEVNGKRISVVPGLTLGTFAKKLNAVGISAKVVNDDTKSRLVITTKGTAITIKDPKGAILQLLNQNQIGTKDTNLIQVVTAQGMPKAEIIYFGPHTPSTLAFELHTDDFSNPTVTTTIKSSKVSVPNIGKVKPALILQDDGSDSDTDNDVIDPFLAINITNQQLAKAKEQVALAVTKMVLSSLTTILRQNNDYIVNKVHRDVISNTLLTAFKQCDNVFLHHIHNTTAFIDGVADAISKSNSNFWRFATGNFECSTKGLADISKHIIKSSDTYCKKHFKV